jgi:hypothetical protein
MFRGALIERNNLDGGIADFFQKAIQDGSLEQDLPPCAGALAEDDVRDSLTSGKGNQTIGWPIRFDSNNRRTELFGECDISLKRSRILRPNAIRRFPRRLDIHGVPRCADPFRNSGTRTEHSWRIAG